MKVNPKIVRFFAKSCAKIKTNSPTIYLVSGIACGVAAVATGIRATMKAPQVKMLLDEELSTVEETYKRVQEAQSQGLTKIQYTEEARDRDIKIAYAHSVWGYIKTYALTAGLEIASITLLVLSHGAMKKRIASLTAACATVTDMFNRYRQNVRNEFGDDVDRRMRYGLVAEKVKEEIVDPETGKKKTVTKEVGKASKELPWRSDYARCYAEGCRGWVKDANQNLLTLRAQQAYANQKLRDNGFLFLNEVYELLGMDQSLAGHEVGWIYEEGNPIGNNYVDFHIDDSPEFVGGLERCIWLDFNVDGPIKDRIKWGKY